MVVTADMLNIPNTVGKIVFKQNGNFLVSKINNFFFHTTFGFYIYVVFALKTKAG